MIRTHLTRLSTALAAVLVLGGCAASPGSAPTVTVTHTVTAEPSLTPDATDQAQAACAAFTAGGEASAMQRVPGALLGIGDQLSGDQLDEILAVHTLLEGAARLAPDDLAAALRRLDEPFKEAADVVAAGGGALNMDTSHVMEDVTAVLELCNGYGFRVDAS